MMEKVFSQRDIDQLDERLTGLSMQVSSIASRAASAGAKGVSADLYVLDVCIEKLKRSQAQLRHRLSGRAEDCGAAFQQLCRSIEDTQRRVSALEAFLNELYPTVAVVKQA